MEIESREERLMRLFGELAGAVVQVGLEHAERDDPHTFQRCNELVGAGATIQIRVDFLPALQASVWLLDAAGDPIAMVCAIRGVTRAASN